MTELYSKTKNSKIPTSMFKIPFECPKCHWIIRHEKPDIQHPIPSTTKPNENIIANDILLQKHICRNPRCQEPFEVFWFKANDFFYRI